MSWTNNVSERGAKAAKRHQAVSGYWHSLATLARWCRIRSYLDTAAAHGITALDAISTAIAGKPWLRAPGTGAPGSPAHVHPRHSPLHSPTRVTSATTAQIAAAGASMTVSATHIR